MRRRRGVGGDLWGSGTHRHVFVDLGDDMLGALYRSERRVDGDSERTKAVLIWRRHLNQCRIQWQDVSSEQAGYLAQKDW